MRCPLMPREGLEREINVTALQTRKVFIGLGSFLAGDPRMKSTLTPSDMSRCFSCSGIWPYPTLRTMLRTQVRSRDFVDEKKGHECPSAKVLPERGKNRDGVVTPVRQGKNAELVVDTACIRYCRKYPFQFVFSGPLR